MLFALALTYEQFLPVAVFGMFAALAWWAMEAMGGGRVRAVERLAELKMPRRRKSSDAILKKSDPMTKVLERATPAFAKPLQPTSEAEKSKIKTKLANAGFRREGAVAVFLGLKFIGLMTGLFLGGGAGLLLKGLTQGALLTTLISVAVGFYLPTVAVGLMARSRKQAIFLSLPDALDLLVVCVEAGLGLDQALRKVSEEIKRTHRILAEELALTNFQLQMGRSRAEALRDLGLRTGVSDLRALTGVLIQADKFGASIADALRVQSDAMRVRRRQLAEEKAAKTAVKLIFPLVLFIFPGIFVVLVGPAAISMMRDMFPKMAN
ncbi:MAG: type II secretion system F family protein [Thermoguttaceae bacterium]